MISVFATKAVNPRGPAYIITAVDVVSESIGVVIIAPLENKGRGPRIGWASIGQRSKRIVAVIVSVGVFPLIPDTGHGIDEVEDQISVSIWIESQHDHIVVNRVPVRHVNRAVSVEHGMNRFVGGDVAKAYRHPRAGLMRTVQFNRVDGQMLGGGVAGQQQKVVACMDHIPCSVNGGSRAFGENNPVARLVHSQERGYGVPSHGNYGCCSTAEVQSIFTGRAA